ncbi:hypothetical protein V501_09335 [Pseudogymnoascus sp. VKM F-4519 (FW-2642)]|nr:hypothetical protein V501_09335 [Pseudogymnoascus sp. VKM F-4519 (FW-2642)]
MYAWTHVLSLLRPPQTRRYAQPLHHYPPIALYGSSISGSIAGGTGGSLATALAFTEALTARGVGRYPSALVTTDSIFDFSPLAITSLHPNAGISSLNILKIRELFSSPPSTLDPLASPLLLFRGSAFHSSAFPGSWAPGPTILPGLFDMDSDSGFSDSMSEVDSDFDFSESMSSPSLMTSPSQPAESQAGNDAPVDIDPTRPQKRSYLKFPPANSGLRLPMCNFQISHPASPPPSKPKKGTKSAPLVSGNEPIEVAQAELMAAAVNRSVRMGYDTPLSRRGDEEGDGDERAVVRELVGEGDVEEQGAVGAREWLRETMDWR